MRLRAIWDPQSCETRRLEVSAIEETAEFDASKMLRRISTKGPGLRPPGPRSVAPERGRGSLPRPITTCVIPFAPDVLHITVDINNMYHIRRRVLWTEATSTPKGGRTCGPRGKLRCRSSYVATQAPGLRGESFPKQAPMSRGWIPTG